MGIVERERRQKGVCEREGNHFHLKKNRGERERGEKKVNRKSREKKTLQLRGNRERERERESGVDSEIIHFLARPRGSGKGTLISLPQHSPLSPFLFPPSLPLPWLPAHSFLTSVLLSLSLSLGACVCGSPAKNFNKREKKGGRGIDRERETTKKKRETTEERERVTTEERERETTKE